MPGQPGDSPLAKNADAIQQMDLDVTELPPQVASPGPGDTDWPFYNRTIDGKRFSNLAMIDESNVGQLEEVCRVRVSGPGPFSAGTILVNGMIYVTAAQATIAIEPTNCDVVWKAIYPFDEDCIAESVAKTGRCVIAHEACLTGGMGAEISSIIQERCFLNLEAPVQRVAGFDTVMPYYKLELDYLPDSKRIRSGIEACLAY